MMRRAVWGRAVQLPPYWQGQAREPEVPSLNFDLCGGGSVLGKSSKGICGDTAIHWSVRSLML